MKNSGKTTARPGRTHDNRRGRAPDAGSSSTSRVQWLTAQLPYAIVLAGVVAGLATIRGGDLAVRDGTLVMAGALLAGALARLVLPEGKAGMLASRRRLVDAAVLAMLGVGLLIAGLIANLPGS